MLSHPASDLLLAPLSGVRVRQRTLPGPDLVELCEALREFADPAVAAVFVRGNGQAEARSVVISPHQSEAETPSALGAWLGALDATGHTAIPASLRRTLCAFKAWTAPIATPGGVYGGVALPTLGLDLTTQRRVANLVCDFALRFELTERASTLLWLKEGANSPESHAATRPTRGAPSR